jgi:hypothetical protein
MKVKLPFVFVINKQEYKDVFGVKNTDRFEIKKHLCELILRQPNNIIFGKTQDFNSQLLSETFCMFSEFVELEKFEFTEMLEMTYILQQYGQSSGTKLMYEKDEEFILRLVDISFYRSITVESDSYVIFNAYFGFDIMTEYTKNIEKFISFYEFYILLKYFDFLYQLTKKCNSYDILNKIDICVFVEGDPNDKLINDKLHENKLFGIELSENGYSEIIGINNDLVLF